jgi:rubrerythrin
MGANYAPQVTTCSKCGRELAGGQCYYCLADEMIAAADSSIESAKQAGATTGKIEEKLLHARRLVAEAKPDQAISVAEEAEEDAKKVREKHKTAKRLMSQLEDDLDKLAQESVNTSTADNQLQLARNFLRSGNYEKAIEFLTKAQDWTTQQAEKAGIKPKKTMVKKPRYSGPFPTCPECGNVVQKTQETCPYCEAPLFEEVPADQVEVAQPTKPTPATGDDEDPSTSTLGLRSMMSEKDVGKIPVAPGVEAKPSIPVSPTKPVQPAPTTPVKEGVCPNCGEEVESEWTKCPFCSAALVAKTVAPPKPAPPPPPPPKPVEVAKPETVKCTSCGSDIEAGWKRCPVCMSPVKAAPAPMPQKPAPPPPKPVEAAKPPPPKPVEPTKPGQLPPPPPPPPSGEPGKEQIDAEVKAIEAEVKALDAKGINTAHAKNLIRLAQSFQKGGAPDKAQRYVRKARQAVDEMKQDQAASGK